MVCLGNICRSPLAEGVMRKLLEEQGLYWEVASAGTGSWHVGKAPDARSVAVAKRFGYDISKQRAQHFRMSFFETYDRIFVMDQHNYQDIVSLTQDNASRDKVSHFLPDLEDVQDPYYEDRLFEPVFLGIEARCKSLLSELNNL